MNNQLFTQHSSQDPGYALGWDSLTGLQYLLNVFARRGGAVSGGVPGEDPEGLMVYAASCVNTPSKSPSGRPK